jgi:tetratricopeptide (TPR) repeat protein
MEHKNTRKCWRKILLCAVISLCLLLPVNTPAAIGSPGGVPGLILTTDILTNFSDFTSAYLNPALLTAIDQTEFTFGGKQWAVTNPIYLSLAVPYGLNHTFGGSILQQGLSGVQLTNDRGEPTNGFGSAAQYVFQGSYAYRLLPSLSIGGNVSTIYSSISSQDDDQFFGATFDFGTRFHPVEDYLMGNISLGLNLQNIYYYQSGTDDLKYPFNVHMQFSWWNDYYRTFLEKFEISANCAIMDLFTEAENFGDPKITTTAVDEWERKWAERRSQIKDISVVWGAHIKWFPVKFAGIRTGVNTDGVIPFGLSLNWKNINVFKRVQLDYDFGVTTIKELDERFAHILRFSARFGKTREEAVSEKWYMQLVREPQNDFEDAMRLYRAKKYWLASFAFGKVIAKWPSFSKVDMATFFLGKSYEYMHMTDAARETYTRGLKKYTTSDFRARFLFQLQNLDYKGGAYDVALRNYGFIMNLYRESDVAPDADYVAGQIYYNKNDFENAIRTLEAIDKSNDNYLYARYTLAMLNVRRKNYDDAVSHLSTIVGIDTVKTVSEKALRDMAFVKLGHIYFERGDLKNAYGAYRQVPLESRFYDEALLGLSWTLVRGGVPESYQEAIKRADNLISTRAKSMLIAEAYLVKGYANTLLKSYDKAAEAYKKTIELCDGTYLSREEYEKRLTRNQTAMQDYNDFQKRAMSLALRKPTPTQEEQKNQMTPTFDGFDEEIRTFSTFKIEADAQFDFQKSAVKLRKDAEYALATTLHLMDSAKKNKLMEGSQEKQKALDKEMQDLQKQLKELED